MTDRERQEWKRLLKLVSRGRASRREIARCMELDRKAATS
jgi:DNA-binding CsgD family transcriptional regulator